MTAAKRRSFRARTPVSGLRGAGTPPRRWWSSFGARMPLAVSAVLVLVPLLVAIFGPLVPLDPKRGLPYEGDARLGTDGLGRDVLQLLLVGGRTALGMALGAVIIAYLIGGVIGLTAASTRHRWVDEVLIRPLDVLLPLPSLLVISVVAVGWRASPLAITLAVAMVNVPTVARLVRAAALDAASGPVVEALRMQRESWVGIQLGYVGRSVLGPVAADVGTRITLAVFLVASVNFLGLGLSPTAPDWAVSVSRNREGVLLQPWAVVAPALMLVAFTLGFNLLADRLVHRTRRLALAVRAEGTDEWGHAGRQGTDERGHAGRPGTDERGHAGEQGTDERGHAGRQGIDEVGR